MSYFIDVHELYAGQCFFYSIQCSLADDNILTLFKGDFMFLAEYKFKIRSTRMMHKEHHNLRK